MTPVRIFILALLGYIAYRLLCWGQDDPSIESSDGRKADEQEDVKDTLVEDPVCHKLIPKRQAIRLRHKGTTYYFCSEKCCDQFNEKQGEKT